jgi:large subunit ribosomal protein L1
MGKIRVAALGDVSEEKEAKRRAEARRQTKDSKKPSGKTQGKGKVEGVGLKGGQRVAVVEGTEINPEYKKLIEEVEQSEKPEETEKKKVKKEKKARIRGKKYSHMSSLVDRSKLYPTAEAVALVKKTSFTKFDGTVELHINLNPLTLGDKKDLRGSVTLPHGTGKEVKVAIADDKILDEVTAGKINFDILVAHPSMMPKLAKVARILGPKGLMPNPKNGTVTPDPDKRAKELSHGQVNFKTEPDQPLIHMIVGKVSFEDKKLVVNIAAVIEAVGSGKVAKATIAATMGPGIKLKI